ncbi:hypothetical protein PR048_013630 [Dryococelus australis]|uniref:Uncharacterized protein n=1 Tax=Dryococelus australis TaxID=614101 RepID=A0ABQ9HSQ4_9NEOP|nr:hypothetical protein PR048_013630 [Dryococelus australis]
MSTGRVQKLSNVMLKQVLTDVGEDTIEEETIEQLRLRAQGMVQEGTEVEGKITKVISVRPLASHQGDSDFRMWESCRMMPLVGGFSRGFPVSSSLSFQHCSIYTSIILIGSQDLDVKSRPNLFTHSAFSLEEGNGGYSDVTPVTRLSPETLGTLELKILNYTDQYFGARIRPSNISLRKPGARSCRSIIRRTYSGNGRLQFHIAWCQRPGQYSCNDLRHEQLLDLARPTARQQHRTKCTTTGIPWQISHLLVRIYNEDNPTTIRLLSAWPHIEITPGLPFIHTAFPLKSGLLDQKGKLAKARLGNPSYCLSHTLTKDHHNCHEPHKPPSRSHGITLFAQIIPKGQLSKEKVNGSAPRELIAPLPAFSLWHYAGQ